MLHRLLVWIVMLAASTAQAETSQDAKGQLSETLHAIQTTHKKQQALEKKRSVLEEEMKTLQKETAAIALDARDQEESLMELEEKTSILDSQKKEKQASLESRRTELSQAITAMIKLGKLPPEAVIAMPGKVHETLSAARALRVITRAVEEESVSLRAQLRELDALETKILKNRESLENRQAALTGRKKQLAEKITTRSKVHNALSGKTEEEKEKLQRLTEKSKSLQDLVDTLGTVEKAQEKKEETQAKAGNIKPAAVPENVSRKGRAFTQAKGRLGLPVAGRIVGLYGHSDGGAAFSKGVMIEARGSGSVVAPFDGEVVYAGVFRDYGKMVILRHKGDYHTLLSGMEEINCSLGQFLLEGEPIGAMGKPTDGGHPKLYVEMRKGGKPIDPMSWFKS